MATKKKVVKKVPAKKAPAKKVPAKKAPVKKSVVKKAPIKKVAAKKGVAKTAPVKKAAALPAEATAKRAVASRTSLVIEKPIAVKRIPATVAKLFDTARAATPDPKAMSTAIAAMSDLQQRELLEALPWCGDDGEAVFSSLRRLRTDGVKVLGEMLLVDKLEAAKLKDTKAILLYCTDKCFTPFCRMCCGLFDHLHSCCGGIWPPCKGCCHCRCCCGSVRVQLTPVKSMCARKLSFTGSGVTVSQSSTTALIDIPGGGVGTVNTDRLAELGVGLGAADAGKIAVWNGTSWVVDENSDSFDALTDTLSAADNQKVLKWVWDAGATPPAGNWALMDDIDTDTDTDTDTDSFAALDTTGQNDKMLARKSDNSDWEFVDKNAHAHDYMTGAAVDTKLESYSTTSVTDALAARKESLIFQENYMVGQAGQPDYVDGSGFVYDISSIGSPAVALAQGSRDNGSTHDDVLKTRCTVSGSKLHVRVWDSAGIELKHTVPVPSAWNNKTVILSVVAVG